MTKDGKKIVAIIIARGGSKSIPRKNVLPLQGKPLVAWPIDLAKSVKQIDRVVVSTDDDEIAEIAREYGAEVPFKRPAELSDDKTETLPVLRHAIGYLEKNENYKADLIFLLYPTAPFLKKERIQEAIKLFEKTGCNSVISVIEDYGRFWKMGENGKYFPFHPKERVNRQYFKPLYREDGAVYFSIYDVVMKMNKLVDDNNIQFLMMREGENVDIDEPQDLKKAQQAVKSLVKIESERLILRSLDNSDITDEYISWLNDFELQKHTRRRGQKTTREDLENFIENSKKSNDFHLAMIIKKDNQHIGNIFLNHVDMRNRSADLSIMIGNNKAHGKGYGSEAIIAITKFAFDQLGLNRLYACSPNPAFNKIIEKVGWNKEGIKRQAFLLDDDYLDVECWSILKKDINEVK